MDGIPQNTVSLCFSKNVAFSHVLASMLVLCFSAVPERARLALYRHVFFWGVRYVCYVVFLPKSFSSGTTSTWFLELQKSIILPPLFFQQKYCRFCCGEAVSHRQTHNTNLPEDVLDNDLFLIFGNYFNPLKPNDAYSWRTAPLTSKVAFYMFIQPI